MAERDATALYESLARFGWWRSRRGVPMHELRGLEIRKRLLPPEGGAVAAGPTDGGAGLDTWWHRLVGGLDARRVIDLGCGFGATAFRAQQAGAAKVLGITPSAYQVRRACEVARARNVEQQVCFEVAQMHDRLPSADLVVAIEALGHTAHLHDVLRNVARSLADAPNGRFVWLEDLLRESPGADPDVYRLADAWCSPPLRHLQEADHALADAGLQVIEEIDLTSQVPRREPAAIDRSLRRLRRLLWITPVPSVRRILHAFAGGLHLERLYARDRACYRLVMAERTQDSHA